MMEITEGSHAVAEAVSLCRPQVISAYPITPQTHIVEALADFVANGKLDAEYITVENEFSALSACIGASAAGSRAYSATTSQGLALMFEVCFNAAGMRLPIIMSIANRALGAPLSIWNDQQDSISLRDSGWLQFYAEDNQEATDLHYIAYRVAEDPSILLPAFVCFDGFILSHTYEPVDMLSQEDVDRYLPRFAPAERLDAADPISFGMYATPEYYLEFRYEMDLAQKRAKDVIAKAGKEFASLFGRDYSALVEGYRLDDCRDGNRNHRFPLRDGQGRNRRVTCRGKESRAPEDTRLPPVPDRGRGKSSCPREACRRAGKEHLAWRKRRSGTRGQRRPLW